MIDSHLSEGNTLHETFSISAKDMEAFAALSGDENPLHRDLQYAKSHGFKHLVVYGGLIVAKISKTIGMKLPGTGWIWHTLSIQFKNPIYIGDMVDMAAQVDHLNEQIGVIRLKLILTRGDTQIAMAEAQ